MPNQLLDGRSVDVGGPPRVRGGHRIPPSLEVLAVFIPVAIVAPLVLQGSQLFLATTVLIYALFALGTNVLFGWTGISSFGQAAYFGTGAYTAGLLKDTIESPVLGILLAALAAGVLAAAFATVSSRITGVEFAMLTLVFGQVLWLLTYRIDALGGENGITSIRRGELFGQNLFQDDLFWWFVIAVVLVGYLVLRRIAGSSFGAAMNAVRDDPLRAAALGVNIRLVRIAAFTVAGVAAGLAGGLMAKQQGLVTPSLLIWSLSGEVIVMCLLGGLRKFWGPAVGAVLLTVLEWFLSDRVPSPLLYVGLALLLVVTLLPGGLASLPSLVRSRGRAHRRGDNDLPA
jgi:branched-chain amino acid transport system permease protein